MISIKKLKSLPKWLYITLTAIALLFAAYLTNQYVNRPRDLGDKVIYLGKETYGCWIPLCASRPTSIYYFGTDLSENELTEYLRSRGGELTFGEQTSQDVSYSRWPVALSNRNEDRFFGFFFYEPEKLSGNYNKELQNNKRHVLYFESSNFKAISSGLDISQGN